MRQIWKKVAALGFLTFLALWAAGSARGWTLPYPEPAALHLSRSSDLGEMLVNPQMSNNLKAIGMAQTPLPLVLDQGDIERIQVFEKTAQLAVGTAAFGDDEAQVRAAVAAHQAVILNDKATGIAPARRLTLEVGVHPEKFEALVTQLRQIGQLDSISVQGRDRTGEFRKLYAQRQALKQYLTSILKLRGGNNPSVEDTLKVEQKIQDIEKELQAVSIQLGDFLGKESYYQVRMALVEFQPGSRLDRTYTLPERLFHAMLWAIVWWAVVALAAGILAATTMSLRTLWPRRSGVAVAPPHPNG